ncbi:MAG: serine hydrolase [Rhodospirillaceae bacterium]|jgi:CubicO group peptidase (beta-lactamase class C family)|nr:serine hydrolase [Rhodospirillaceae bacterium]
MKVFFVFVGVTASVLAAVIASDWTFWSRFMNIRDQTALSYPSWIAPTREVRGRFEEELPSVAPVDVTLTNKAITELVTYAETLDSFSLIVHRGLGIQFEAYWRGMGPDDVTETYSMAKSVLGIMVGFAVSDGFIGSIDDPVAKYVPEWDGADRSTLTLRDLLQMASGLEHYRFNFDVNQNPFNKAIRLFIGSNMEEAILRFDLTAAPGSEFTYNSANTQLLMLILQRAIGKPYAGYVSEKFWQPLGAKPARLWMDRENGMPKAYSFFQARPRDWLRIGLAIKNNGAVNGKQVIPANWLMQMKTPSPNNPKYGLQLWIGSPYVPERFYNSNTPVGVKQAEPFLVDDVVFFDGGGGQRVYVIPSADLVIIRTGMPSPQWDDGVIPNIILSDLGYGQTQ